MADFSTTNVQTAAFDMSDADNVNFITNEAATPTVYGWDSPNAVDIDIGGTGFTYSGGVITGATTVTGVDIDIDGDQAGAIGTGDILIDNFDASVAANITAVDNSARGFWGTFLEGADDFNLNGFDSAVTGTSVFFGDDFASSSGVFVLAPEVGAADTFTSGDSTMDIIGDVYTVQGSFGIPFSSFAWYEGGDDMITAVTSDDRIRSIGDAWTVGQFATLTGGDDTINNSANRNVSSVAVGDVWEQTGGTVNGGNDILITDGTGAPEATGDVREFSGSGTMNGGDDTITIAITDDAGGGSVEGDIGAILAGAGGTVNAGDDTILGGDESDVIYGDVRSVSGTATTTIVAGDDVIFGGRGVDFIYGETSSSGALGQFTGGNDVLFGEEGNDTLFGPDRGRHPRWWSRKRHTQWWRW